MLKLLCTHMPHTMMNTKLMMSKMGECRSPNIVEAHQYPKMVVVGLDFSGTPRYPMSFSSYFILFLPS
jgi:hypothetical protein